MSLSYEKKTWSDTATSGTPITSADLNKYEGMISSIVNSINAISDYVVMQNTSGIWRYRLWNSGFAECFAKTKTSGLTSGWKTVLKDGNYDNKEILFHDFQVNLPFTAVSFISAYCNCDYTGYCTVQDPNGTNGINWLKVFAVRIFEQCTSQGINLDHNVTMYWCGTWK